MRGHAFSSESADEQLSAVLRANTDAGRTCGKVALPPVHSSGGTDSVPVLVQERDQERSILNLAFALSGPLQDTALSVISQCHSPETPRCGFYCRKTFSSSAWPSYSFLPFLPERPSELLLQRTLSAWSP